MVLHYKRKTKKGLIPQDIILKVINEVKENVSSKAAIAAKYDIPYRSFTSYLCFKEKLTIGYAKHR